jgi:hypothetical protein
MGRASKTDPPLTAGAQAPAAPTLPPDGAALSPALAGRLAASAERAGEAPDAHLERLLGPALDAEEERHPSKTQIRIARGIGIVLAALALLTIPYVVQTGDLFKGLVIWFATVYPAIRLMVWPVAEMNTELARHTRRRSLHEPSPGSLDATSQFLYRRH